MIAHGGSWQGFRAAIARFPTTTPWTIPANQALNIHPEFSYDLVDTERGLLVLATERKEACLATYKLAGTTVAQARGDRLSLIRFRHPFYDRDAPVYLGDYVTLDTGTGIVHSSPAYGVVDFVSCKEHGMTDEQILNPVQGDGVYADSLPLFGGQKIWDANPKIVDVIREHGALLHVEKFPHSYMHCWRHRTPIVYRATSQWFAGMDTQPKDGGPTLRELALAGIEATSLTFLTSAVYPWGSAVHTYIASHVKPGNPNVWYGAMAPDLFNYAFEIGALKDVMYDQLHGYPQLLWNPAGTSAEKSLAYGFLLHREADYTAHYGGVQFGKLEGYIIAKAKVLNDILASKFPEYAAIKAAYPALSLSIAHNIVENSIDILIKRMDPLVVLKLMQAATLRDAGFPRGVSSAVPRQESWGLLRPRRNRAIVPYACDDRAECVKCRAGNPAARDRS